MELSDTSLNFGAVSSSSVIRYSDSMKYLLFELNSLSEKEVQKQRMEADDFVRYVKDMYDQKKLLYSKDEIYYIIEDGITEKPVVEEKNQLKRKVLNNSKRVSFKINPLEEKENFENYRNLRNRSILKPKKILKKYDIIESKMSLKKFSETPKKNNDYLAQTGFRTPLSNRKNNYKVAEVTPKPLNKTTGPTILRRPKSGEMAISMHGSPLLTVTTNDPTRVPQINIPLGNGRVMTVHGEESIDPEDFPELKGTETLAQLKKLHEFLSKAIRQVE